MAAIKQIEGVYEWREDGPFYVCYVPKKDRNRRGGYRWLVTRTGPHTAFHTDAGLVEWLRRTGLQLPINPAELEQDANAAESQYREGMMRKEGQHGIYTVEGTYYRLSAMDKAIVDNAEGESVPVMDNGSYTEGKLIEWEGRRAILCCNPNVRDRVIYDWRSIVDSIPQQLQA